MTRRIPIILAAGLAALLGSAGSASAQLTLLGSLPQPIPSSDFRGDVGYDPAHDVYLKAFRGPRRGPFLVPTTMGTFKDRAGKTLHTFDIINDSVTNIADGEDIRVAYSPDVSNGSGGFGGFLVIRAYSGGVWAHLVFYPGVAGPRIPVFTEANVDKAAVAYSPVDRQFLVAWGGGPEWNRPGAPPQFVRVDLNGQRIGFPTLLRSERECDSPYPYPCDEVDVAWNPTTNEFGVLYNDHGKVLARVRGDGTIAGRSVLGVGSRLGALAVNTNLGNYLAIGSALTCCRPAGVELNGNGQILAKGEITSAIDTAGASIDDLVSLSYSPGTGTFVLVGRQAGADFVTGLAIELNQHGAALASALPLGISWIVPRAINPGGAAEWLLLNSMGLVVLVGTATPYGGSDVNLAGCIGLDPFVTLGGGTCVNGGWLPPGMVPPTPPPPPPISIPCLSPDPFTALGEGVCVNGGWVPPGHPLAGPAGPAPPGSPPPSPSSCATPDPFVSIGGGVCINGGWVPKTHPLAGGG